MIISNPTHEEQRHKNCNNPLGFFEQKLQQLPMQIFKAACFRCSGIMPTVEIDKLTHQYWHGEGGKHIGDHQGRAHRYGQGFKESASDAGKKTERKEYD